jgi:hypothetical protein
MNLQLSAHFAEGYNSPSQRARRVTEPWGTENLYCCACASDELDSLPNNARVSDFVCPDCTERYQLKSQSKKIGGRVLGSNYQKMLDAIAADQTPHFFLLRYQLPAWLVRDLLLIPKFTITNSVVIPRKPLGETARRKHWQGYTLDLGQIPDAAKISLVTAGVEREPSAVRADFSRIAPVREMKSDQRGWTLDVLRCVEKLGAIEFTNEKAYEFERHLSALHPGNRHVRDKIRQQLQVLRDLGFLEHVEKGRWRRK